MKKIGYLGLVLFCGIALSACSSTDTSKLEEKLDKITKNVDSLHSKVDELSENGIASSTSESSEEETEESTKESKETKDSSKTKESSETKESKSEEKSTASADKVKGTVIEDDYVKLTVTDVKFIGNILSSVNDSEVMAVIYYTVENLSDDKLKPSGSVPYYFDVLEEDDISEDSLYSSDYVEYYKEFEDLYANTRLSIKSGAKIDGIMSYQISSKEKSVNINIYSESGLNSSDRSIIASQTYTAEEIAKDVKKNDSIEPNF